jgi:hypothetical protein
MLKRGKTLVNAACCALCCLAAAAYGVKAAPPSGIGPAKPSRATGALDLRRLDLRPPDFRPSDLRPGPDIRPAEHVATPFPSAKRSQLAPARRAEDDLPELGSREAVRTASRAEQLVRRVHQEGVPFARLWETRSALLHVGLSPRGKPGLWLIQKVP